MCIHIHVFIHSFMLGFTPKPLSLNHVSPLIFRRTLGGRYYSCLYSTNEEIAHGHKASKSDIIEAYYIFGNYMRREIQ